MLNTPEVMALRVYVTFLVYQLREANKDERGEGIVQTVLIIAAMAAAAIAITAIIVKKFTDKANAIPTE